MLKGFRDFILRGNVMDLAVAVIIGAAFTAIVTSLTEKIINPLLGAVVGKPALTIIIAEEFLHPIARWLMGIAVPNENDSGRHHDDHGHRPQNGPDFFPACPAASQVRSDTRRYRGGIYGTT